MGDSVSQTEDLNQESAPFTAQALGVLQSNKTIWSSMEPAERLQYLKKMLVRLQDVDHEAWGVAAVQSFGFRTDHRVGDFQVGMESMVNASVFVGTVKHLIRTASVQAKTGCSPKLKCDTRDGREVVQVFPVDRDDRFSPEGMSGCSGEVWLHPEGPSHDVQNNTNGDVCLVLGAGNQSFLAFGDVMHQMFVEGSVCILKHHPLRAFSAPYFDEIFADLIEDGFFYSCTADLEETHALLHSPLVDRVHMTGGSATHDAIVWGNTKAIQEENKAKNEPVLGKPMTSELGAVTPWIVMPGAVWTQKEIDHMAGHLVAAFTAQNSCNCLSPKLLVLDADWPQVAQFMKAVRDRLRNTPLVPPHYPGAAERYRGFTGVYSVAELEMIDAPTTTGMSEHDLGPCLPWLLLHLDDSSDPYAWKNEAFAPVLAIYNVRTGNEPEAFAKAVVPFANESVWGSLSCTLIAHPDVEGSLVEGMIGDLRYGSIALNAWTAGVYSTSGMTWGAYPGEPLNNVASGRGIVRNAYALSHVEKSVFRSPFIAKSQLVVSESGRIEMTSAQFRAIRQLLVRPGMASMLAVIREMATPEKRDQQSLMQKCTVHSIRFVESVMGLVVGLFGRSG